jgi:uncharacterized damage-inducible protein DinB
MVQDFTDEYRRYRLIGERALEQLTEPALNQVTTPDGNSAAMLVRHLSGNLISRFTDFLTSDGEKPWRDRDREFADRAYSRSEVEQTWTTGWGVLEGALGVLTDADLSRQVLIRGRALSVHAALCRSATHVSYHVGQLVLLARQGAEAPWQWISIPKGESMDYNARPHLEKSPV